MDCKAPSISGMSNVKLNDTSRLSDNDNRVHLQ